MNDFELTVPNLYYQTEAEQKITVTKYHHYDRL